MKKGNERYKRLGLTGWTCVMIGVVVLVIIFLVQCIEFMFCFRLFVKPKEGFDIDSRPDYDVLDFGETDAGEDPSPRVFPSQTRSNQKTAV
jgi:hypothetical protein